MKDINSLSSKEKKELFNSIDAVCSDCDGVLWLGGKPIAGASDTINRLKEQKKKVFFVTNNSTRTRQELVEMSKKFGFNVTFEEMVTSPWLTALYLKSINFNKKIYIVGVNAIAEELSLFGIKCEGPGADPYISGKTELDYVDNKDPEVAAVIVGHDVNFSYPKMIKACNYLYDPECLFIATNTDASLPLPQNRGVKPGAGCFVRSIQTCAGREPVIIGKPSKTASDELIKATNLDRNRVMMIGDRCDTDIAFAKTAGFKSLLVFTGVESLHSVENYKKENKTELVPDYYANSIADLLNFMEAVSKP